MTLAAGCPRCASPVTEERGTWRCLDHGPITPVWRPAVADYDTFAEHLLRSAGFPTILPWPLSPGWSLTDFGCVALPGHEARATFAACTGASDLDGVVELMVVSEEPGVGLGARCAGVTHTDPGGDIEGPSLAKVRLDGHPVALWPVPVSAADLTSDRSVLVGEALGRWLWMVFRPASAALLLEDGWIMLNIADLGPELVDLPFGGSPSAW